ncbi:MAG: cation-translocating P-type ATPase [Candidatus Pacearchaeota archaeon]
MNSKGWHSLDRKEVLEEFASTEEGLSQEEASKRLEKYGKNELRQIAKINPVLIFLKQFHSVFIYILFVAALFSLLIKHYIDFGVITGVILINSSIGFFQQYKAEKMIVELKHLLVPKVMVFRSGKLQEITSTEIVPGDIISLTEGDKVMADCRILESHELQANEAVLTGESFPVDKHTEAIAVETLLPDRKNMVYMGTSIVNGNGKAIVVATGMNTEFGKIAELVQTVKREKTPLEKKLDIFSENVAMIVILLAILTTLIGLFRGEETHNMLLAGMALAISVIPEGIPAVIAITLALAIRRMQKSNALIRKLPTAETLGRTTVICTDKTGTITVEEMTVTELYCNKETITIDHDSFMLGSQRVEPQKGSTLYWLMKTGIMCNNARMEDNKIYGDPTEKALIISARKAALFKKEETEKEARIKEFAFSSKRKLMSIVRKNEEGLVSYVKGAPDVILKHCTKELANGKIVELTKERKFELFTEYERMASKALRVLAFAFRKLPSNFTQEMAESHLVFVGFQGMLDPPRKEVKKAIQECKEAGIKVKMLTGDSLLTAKAIGRMVDLDGDAIEGYELGKLSEEEFDKAVREKNIFARIDPELKHRIIKSLKKQNEIVAATGDGVNDVLALKEAHIGVAMGVRGTDVAREVSDIVLLDDNFNSIVNAVKEGRKVYDNMKKTIKFHLAANVSELFVVIFALILAFPLPILPSAILWMNLITDSAPSLALSVEKTEPDAMKKKPVSPKENILDGIKSFILIAGGISCIATLILFMLYYHQDLAKARTMALTTLVVSEFFIAFTCRSEKNLWKIGTFSNKFLNFSVLAAFVMQIIAIYTPLSVIFEFKALSLTELLITIAFASLGLIFFETKKAIKMKNRGKP